MNIMCNDVEGTPFLEWRKFHRYLCLVVACISQVPDVVPMCDTDEMINFMEKMEKESNRRKENQKTSLYPVHPFHKHI